MFKGLNKKEQVLLLFLLIVVISGGLIKFLTKKHNDIRVYKLQKEETVGTPQPSQKTEQVYEQKSDIDMLIDKSINPEQDKKIDLNTATIPELDRLPGIGPVKAKSIIDYRNKIGKFTDLEQLKDVRGIGDKTFDAIKDSVYIKADKKSVEKQELKEESLPFQAPLEITRYPEFKNLKTPAPVAEKKVSEKIKTATEKININTADETELRKLKGIGEKKAKAIIDYRNKYGNFKIPADLMKVKGIGQKTFINNQEIIITQ